MHDRLNFKNDDGMTLVEILAALVILSILILSFLALFGQSAKQNKNSEQVMDATYIAQVYMEDIYAISSKYTFELGLIEMKNDALNYGTYTALDDDIHIFKVSKDGYFIEIELVKLSGEREGELLVKVYDALDETKLKAQMETVLFWGQ